MSSTAQPNNQFSKQTNNTFDDYLQQRNSWNGMDWYPYTFTDHLGFYPNPPVFDTSYNEFSFKMTPSQQPQHSHQNNQQFPHNIKQILQTPNQSVGE